MRKGALPAGQQLSRAALPAPGSCATLSTTRAGAAAFRHSPSSSHPWVAWRGQGARVGRQAVPTLPPSCSPRRTRLSGRSVRGVSAPLAAEQRTGSDIPLLGQGSTRRETPFSGRSRAKCVPTSAGQPAGLAGERNCQGQRWRLTRAGTARGRLTSASSTVAGTRCTSDPKAFKRQVRVRVREAVRRTNMLVPAGQTTANCSEATANCARTTSAAPDRRAAVPGGAALTRGGWRVLFAGLASRQRSVCAPRRGRGAAAVATRQCQGTGRCVAMAGSYPHGTPESRAVTAAPGCPRTLSAPPGTPAS